MRRRIVVRCLSIALASALATALLGCNRGAGKAPSLAVNPVAQARKDLFDIAKKIEDKAAVESLEFYVTSFEKGLEKDADPDNRWTWAELNDLVIQGNFSFQTKQAYEAWRKAKIAADKKR